LKSILKKGFLPSYCLEDIDWVGIHIAAVAIPVVCFCDIPLSRITDHIQFYGQYGIGMKHDWAKAKGLNPIIYVSKKSHVAFLLKMAMQYIAIAQKSVNEPYKEIRHQLLGYCKPLIGQTSYQGAAVTKEFYLESEWRFLATHDQIPVHLGEGRFRDPKERDKANALAAQYCALSFTPQDVKYLFVENESDIPDLVNFVESSLSQYPTRDVQTLITRIMSQDTIKNDI
jgi:hypothetical protein